jgi:LmbE family N-acetylglucosaminyl deacetylase
MFRPASEHLTGLIKSAGSSEPLIRDPDVNSNSRVLVIAPHHFDEIIGCGGTMCKMAKKGAHIKVLFLTDSSYCDIVGPGCGLVPMEPMEVKESLASLRCYESERLDLPCMGIRPDIESRRALLKVIEYYSPDHLFIPSLRDVHPDNKMTGLLAARTLKDYTGCLTLYSYEVWGGLFPNTMVEITDVIDDKIAAIRVRKRRSKMVDEENRIKETNCFRLSTMQDDRYGEPFLRQGKKDFLDMTRFLPAHRA